MYIWKYQIAHFGIYVLKDFFYLSEQCRPWWDARLMHFTWVFPVCQSTFLSLSKAFTTRIIWWSYTYHILFRHLSLLDSSGWVVKWGSYAYVLSVKIYCAGTFCIKRSPTPTQIKSKPTQHQQYHHQQQQHKQESYSNMQLFVTSTHTHTRTHARTHTRPLARGANIPNKYAPVKMHRSSICQRITNHLTLPH